MMSLGPLWVALGVSAVLARLPSGVSRGVILALASGAGLGWAGEDRATVLWVAGGGSLVALLSRGWGGGLVGASLWLAIGPLISMGPLLQRQGLTWSLGVVLAGVGSGVLGGAALVWARAPGRGSVLALSALGVALAMLLPGSSLRLGTVGLVVAAAALPLVRSPDEDDGLAWVGAGLLAWGTWQSVLLASLDETGVWLLLLLGVPLLGARLRTSPRRALWVQLGAVLLVVIAALFAEIRALWMEGIPL